MEDYSIILAGNPNVGKSSLFNHFTHSRQHTGNWSGKTVGNACAQFEFCGKSIKLTDTPGTYSLSAVSKDEEKARDAILFSEADCTVIVCDACRLERSLFLALQIMEAIDNVVICINFMDEAKDKGIEIDIEMLEKRLGCPVTAVSAKKKENLEALLTAALKKQNRRSKCLISPDIHSSLEDLENYFERYRPPLPALWLALQLSGGRASIIEALSRNLGLDIYDEELSQILQQSRCQLGELGLAPEGLIETHELALKARAAEICRGSASSSACIPRGERLLTSRFWAWATLLGLLFAILWLSIFAAEYPGRVLAFGLDHLGKMLFSLLQNLHFPPRLVSMLCDGVYTTLTTVIAVMLPPLAVFYPLFSLLEEWGYLPRLAFNMDGYFKKFGGCGKQSLSMCMGLGCNTVGISGCRIIESPREKYIAMLTNSFMPCNGRFPMLISIAAYMFRDCSSPWASLFAACAVMSTILLSAIAGLAASKLLSLTLFSQDGSCFVLEIPPLRRPAFLRVIKTAFVEKSLYVLLRALKFAAPAGMFIWLLANTNIGDVSILGHASEILEPVGAFMGLDGAILLAFILGLPASEIVLPIILMCYLSSGSIAVFGQSQLFTILSQHGWDTAKSLCMMIFTLMHWPCVSALCAIYDETGKYKYVFYALLIPSLFGVLLCSVLKYI